MESLGVLTENKNSTFCSCDAAAIRTLPHLNLTNKGISVEKLLKKSGFTSSNLEEKHTEKYFKENIEIGQIEKIQKILS